MLMEETVRGPARPRPRRVRAARLTVVVAVVFAAGTAMRLGGLEAGFLLVPLVSFTPHFAVAALVALTWAVWARSRAAVAILLAVCVCLAWLVVPRALPGSAAAQGRPLRLLTANLNGGRGDAEVVVDLVRKLDVDVFSVQELTWSARERLTAAGLRELLPYEVSAPMPRGPEGSGIYARYPLRERSGLFRPVGHHMPVAQVALPGGPVEVVVVHPVAPVPPTVREWEAGIATLPPAPDDGPPRVLAGDFNATLDHVVFRRLLATGYADAAAETGNGLAPTWPMRRFPPLVAIDHVLTDGRGAAVATQVLDVPGSDHRALFAELRIQ